MVIDEYFRLHKSSKKRKNVLFVEFAPFFVDALGINFFLGIIPLPIILNIQMARYLATQFK